jgi:hypothetical protein
MADDQRRGELPGLGRQFIERMSPESGPVFEARALAYGAFSHDPLPDDLVPTLFATIDEIADESIMSSTEIAIEAFRRHGYRAEMRNMGEVAMMRAVRVQG